MSQLHDEKLTWAMSRIVHMFMALDMFTAPLTDYQLDLSEDEIAKIREAYLTLYSTFNRLFPEIRILISQTLTQHNISDINSLNHTQISNLLYYIFEYKMYLMLIEANGISEEEFLSLDLNDRLEHNDIGIRTAEHFRANSLDSLEAFKDLLTE